MGFRVEDRSKEGAGTTVQEEEKNVQSYRTYPL